MPPKRSAKVVIKTTKKVVKETVQVAVVKSKGKPRQDTDQEPLKTILIEDKEQQEEHQIVQVPIQEAEPSNDLPSSLKQRKEEKTQERVETDKKSKTLEGKDDNERRKRRRGRRKDGGQGYKRYVFKVLKQVHPEMTISSKAMTVINGLMNDMSERIADEAARLLKYNHRMTLSSRELQGAVKLVLPGDLGMHAIAEGNKAVTNYMYYNA